MCRRLLETLIIEVYEKLDALQISRAPTDTSNS